MNKLVYGYNFVPNQIQHQLHQNKGEKSVDIRLDKGTKYHRNKTIIHLQFISSNPVKYYSAITSSTCWLKCIIIQDLWMMKVFLFCFEVNLLINLLHS